MVMIIVLLVMAGLIAITTMTLLSSITTVTSAGDERAKRVALYAAESGIAVGTEWLFANCVPGTFFSAYMTPSNTPPLVSPPTIPGNALPLGSSGNPFDTSLQAWYQVTIENNYSDPGYTGLVPPLDHDATVILRSQGYGPDNAQVVIEENVYDGACAQGSSNGTYSQQGANAGNTGVTSSATVQNSGTTVLNANTL